MNTYLNYFEIKEKGPVVSIPTDEPFWFNEENKFFGNATMFEQIIFQPDSLQLEFERQLS